MPIADKVAAAKKVSELLNTVIKEGNLHLKYRIMVDPPQPHKEFTAPEILVELSGPDSSLLLERNAELLRSLEFVCIEMLRLTPDEHDKLQFDSMGYRATRLDELKMAAQHAAAKVRDSGMPYSFAPMSSRERRIVHIALRGEEDLRTESAGEAGGRHVVLYPKDYKGAAPAERRPSFGRGRGRR